MNAKDPNDPNYQVLTKGTYAPLFCVLLDISAIFLHLVAQKEYHRVNWRYSYN